MSKRRDLDAGEHALWEEDEEFALVRHPAGDALSRLARALSQPRRLRGGLR